MSEGFGIIHDKNNDQLQQIEYLLFKILDKLEQININLTKISKEKQ